MEKMLDRYLDGLLGGQERASFERRLAGDSAIAGEIACQRRIDACLDRLFAPPGLQEMGSRIAAVVWTAPPRVVSAARPVVRVRVLAVAAVIGVLAVLGLQLWSELRPGRTGDPYAPQPRRSVAQVYVDTVDSGFRPNWVCKNEREFTTAFHRHLGQGLAFVSPPPGIAWAGVDYCNSISPSTMTVLAHVRGQPVIVFADRASVDKGATTVPPGSALRLFRREVGGLVLYECTPHDQAYLLDLLYAPGMDAP